MIHRVILCVAAFVIGGGLPLFSAEPTWVTYPAKDGPGQGRHVVLLSGDEEYRSEEALPMLGKILSQRHGFKCTVLFSVDADGTINPDNQRSLSHPEALDSADVIVMSLRFRKWPDDVMKRFVDAYLAGKPIIALRTSTHAFDYPKGSTYARYGWTSGEWKGGFGKQVLGETWVSHWGRHKVEATRGVLEPAAQSDPLLRGIESLFGDTDVYEAYPPADAKILVRGQVLTGMKPTDPPATYRKKRASDGQEQAVNEPMMPVAWSRIHTNEAGRLNKILCTTMGSATDLQDEGLRRLLVNGVYWALGLEVPARANVDYVGEFKPTMYGFKGYQKGVKPSVHALNAKPAATAPAPAPVPGKLTLQKGDHIALIGNALAERMQHDSAFETLLHRAFPEHDLTVRNLGFSGDEIVTRARSENFGSPDDWLTRVKADVILAFFGFNESFKGYGGLDKFRSDLANFIKDTLGKNYSGKGPPRLVLVSPIAAERLPDPNFPDPSLINDNLRDYTLAMADVARAHGVQLVNLFDLSKQLQAASATPLTHNGIHLTEAGNERLAPVLFRELLGQEPPAWDAATEQLRRAVQEKNRMWFSRYRTVDGYNVYGGRSALAYQPDKGGFISDRDAPEPHVSNYKVMQREMAIRDVMTENRDRRVWALARGRDLKVDDSNAPEPIPVKTNKPGPKEDKSHEYLDGEAAIARMKLAPGCRVGLFASEKEFPALVNPVQMAWDTRGRLWVAVWPNYPERTPWSTNGDSLVVFEDTNADGRADKMTTFIDDLNCPTGFQFYKDGVILVQAPDVWFVRDTDGDGRADWKERILGSLDSADSHHTANALCLDPGGAIYLSDGVFHRTQVETARGPVRNVDGAIYRFEPRTGRFEVYVAYGFANPHGRVFDYWGNDLITDATGNNTYFGPAFSGRLDSGKHSSLEEFWKRPSRPCPGTAILSSRHFPEEFQGNFLNCNVISLLAIFRAKIREEGSGLRGETLEHLVISDDPNFRPSAVTVAPDGSIYFTDWHQAII
ncbi:MAG TPA: PVC-type heme-binding CxxCH protein, partial [Methylomirabilota bacterium]|nr:PVC-type heme-binding CxxCH protein [Methylomirabilota bacterium]